ncbi:MAG: hypothetical protein ABIF10_02085 [Candidatus Woesearchaeota archaeon]
MEKAKKIGKLKEHVLLSYSTEHLQKKDKVRFFYALNGRTEKGLIERTKAERVGRTVLMASPKYLQEFKEFFSYWKCSWKSIHLLAR